MKNIVIIGGGTGTSTLLVGLKKYPVNLSAVVSTADDGGSTGRLREQYGGVPVGDIRACLLALSGASENIKENMAYRFDNGHVVMNVALAQYQYRFGIERAIAHFARFLKVKGQVIPVTLKATKLSAILENGHVIHGEHNIDEPSGKFKFKIKNLNLRPSMKANPQALKKIKNADVIIFGPGDLFTSTLPNLLVKGIPEAINKSRAKKILITNIMTKFGQSDGYKPADFVKVLERYLKGRIDLALVNKRRPGKKVLQVYAKQKSKFIEPDVKELAKTPVETIAADLLSEQIFKKKSGDKLTRSLLRHDSKKLSKLIWELV